MFDGNELAKIFDGIVHIIIMVVVLSVVALVTLPLAIWKIVDLLN
jgi:hypothetical protein